MTGRDYYADLGVSRTANDDEIKAAFRKIAMADHPDRNPDPEAHERFKRATEAFTVLRDAESRTAYDQGERSPSAPPFSGRYPSPDDLLEWIDDIFPGFSGHRRPQQGGSIRTSLSLELRHVLTGGSFNVTLQRNEQCGTCSGRGGESSARCHTCSGRGHVIRSQGFFSVKTPCHVCEGRGSRVVNPCSPCNGRGVVSGTRKVSIKIPAGIESGRVLRVAGYGHCGLRGGESGDLFVEIVVQSHPTLARRGADVTSSIKVPVYDAVTGGEVEVETLDGLVSLRIPPRTAHGTILLLSGKGLPKLGESKRGNHRVKIEITMDELSDDEIAELRASKSKRR